MSNPRIVVLILNWNKPEDTVECISSCKAIDYDNFEILLVDNHSEDKSVEIIRSHFPDLSILVTPENLGYAGGNNVGLREAIKRGADYILLLNNDVTVDKNVLRELLAAAKKNPQAGILAPKVLYYDDPTTINTLGTRMNWFKMRPHVGECNQKDSPSFSLVRERDILVGCALFLPAETLKKIGLIEENFFIFHEEADWCHRSLRAGYRNLVIPQAVIYHKASKTMREFSVLTHYYSSRNFLYFVKRNASVRQKILVAAGLTLFSVKHFLEYLFPRGDKDRKMASAFFLGICDYFAGRMGKCQRSF